MMSQQEIEDLVQKSKTFAALVTAGALNVEALNQDAAALAAIHGINIPTQNKAQYNKAIAEQLARLGITRAEDFSALSSDDRLCNLCMIGMTTAFAALIVLTVAAVVYIVTLFFPEVAVPAVITFLESSSAVEIVFDIILTGAEVLASICCINWGACQ